MSSTKLQIGIVGLPNVGKSTLFNALTRKSVPVENYPFCTIDPSVGIVAVPDERLQKLSIFSQSERTIPAAVEFVDIAGLVRGASEGEGLGNQFLAHIREVDVIAHVVRLFDDTDITHVHGEVNPLADIDVINLELVLADMQTVVRRLSNIDKDIRGGSKDAIHEKTLLERLHNRLGEGKLLRGLEFTEKEVTILRGFHLLTVKPMLYVLNKKSGGHNIDEMNDKRFEELQDFFKVEGDSFVLIDAHVEQELNEVSEDEKESFKQELGALDDGISTLIRKGYELLNLITFFTTGEKETRGWTITRGSTAPIAGAAIHSDFKDKFIRADVIPWHVLLEAGSYTAARDRGLIKTVGKEYTVKDGDVMEFKI